MKTTIDQDSALTMQPHSQARWHLAIRWVLITIFATIAGAMVSAYALGAMYEIIYWPFLFSELIASLIGGFVVGVGQWSILRQYFRQASWWIVATTVGSMTVSSFIPYIVASFIPYIMSSSIWVAISPNTVFYWMISGLANGTLIGLTQWLFLRSHVHRAGWWVWASILARTTGTIVSRTIGLPIIDTSTAVLSGIINGLIVGTITGVALLGLMHSPTRLISPAAKDVGSTNTA